MFDLGYTGNWYLQKSSSTSIDQRQLQHRFLWLSKLRSHDTERTHSILLPRLGFKLWEDGTGLKVVALNTRRWCEVVWRAVPHRHPLHLNLRLGNLRVQQCLPANKQDKITFRISGFFPTICYDLPSKVQWPDSTKSKLSQHFCVNGAIYFLFLTETIGFPIFLGTYYLKLEHFEMRSIADKKVRKLHANFRRKVEMMVFPPFGNPWRMARFILHMNWVFESIFLASQLENNAYLIDCVTLFPLHLHLHSD